MYTAYTHFKHCLKQLVGNTHVVKHKSQVLSTHVTQGVKIKPVTMATNKAASLDEELGDITSYEFGQPITAILITSCLRHYFN